MNFINTKNVDVKKLETQLAENVSQHSFLEQLKLKFVYGVQSDGITDDTIAIQSAFNALTLNDGGKIVFPKGSCKITSPILITKNFLTIEGVGQGSFIYNVGTTSSFIFTDCERISIRDLYFKGNGGAKGVGATNLHGIEFINTHHVKMYNLTIMYNGGHGIYNHGGAWCHYLSGCYIGQNKLDGINSVSPSGASLDQNGNNLSITNTSISGNGGNGVKWKASGLNVTGSNIESNELSGILIDTNGSTLTAYGINIVGNEFESNKQGQIKFTTIAGYFVSGVFIDGNYFYSPIVGGATSLIVASGVADSLVNFEIGQGNHYEISGATVIKHIDLGSTPSIYSKIAVRDLNLCTGLGRGEVKLPIKNLALSGLFHQKGYAFSTPNKSDNIHAMTPKTGFYELPLKEGDYLYKIRCFVETNCTDNYTVTLTAQNADLTTTNSLATISSFSTVVTGGGNKIVEWVVYGSVAYRHLKNNNLYLKIDITNPATGSTMYLHDLVVEYI